MGLKWVAGSGGVPEITTSWGCILLLDEYVRLQLYRDRKRLQGRAQAVYKVCTVYCIQPSAARLCRFALDNEENQALTNSTCYITPNTLPLPYLPNVAFLQ